MRGPRDVVPTLVGLLLGACHAPSVDAHAPAAHVSVRGVVAPTIAEAPALADAGARESASSASEAGAGAREPASSASGAGAASPEPVPPANSGPAPAPIPFEGRQTVRLRELIAELELVADELSRSADVRADYESLVAAHGLRDSDALYRDYVRVKLAFEATRAGGLWRLHWTITNEKPNSERIWAQWRKAERVEAEPSPTALAECDELSAVFAFVAGQLGVRHIGLFWPQWNHVVAVWTVPSDDGASVRVVVPTSQIFLSDEDSLGTTAFDPSTQRTIYEYRRRDVKDSHRVDADLARFFVQQARRYGGRPQRELQRLRNAREQTMAQYPTHRRDRAF